MAAFWAEMGVAYLEINKLHCLHEIDTSLEEEEEEEEEEKRKKVQFHTSKNIKNDKTN
jgi:hypothetical protein